MAVLPDIKEKWLRNNPWCKEIIKFYDHERLADAIQKRIQFPNTTGPFVQAKENPVSVIIAFILGEDGFREKIAPAIGFLLYKQKNDKMPEDTNLLRGLFTIIRWTKLEDEHILLYNWLTEKAGWLVSNDEAKKYTYREGMIAFALIQKKDPTIELYWHNIWKEGKSFWWQAAFLGLRIQNPKLASEELPLLMSRKLDKSPELLEGMWKDENTKHQLECAIKRGLKSNDDQYGLMLNQLLEKLTEEQRKELMGNLN